MCYNYRVKFINYKINKLTNSRGNVMGWHGTYTEYASAKEFVEGEVKLHLGFVVLQRVIKKDNYCSWIAYTLQQNTATKEKSILIHFIEKDDSQWSYKEFHESAHPCVYTCPKSMLNKSDCQSNHAVEWRNKNIELGSAKVSEKKRIIELFKQLKKGAVIKMGLSTLVFSYIYNKTGTQIACTNETGGLFRYSFDQFTPESLLNAIQA